MNTIPYQTPCPGVVTGMPGLLITQMMQTLITTQCLFGNPEHYPDDFGEKLADGQEFDFVVVGGGSAGSVVASRLSEVEGWRVLLLEAGDTPRFESDVPGFTFSVHGTEMDWNYRSEREEGACLSMEDGRCRLAKGKVLGGSSAINLMHYVRGNPDDFDEWERSGCPGWNFENVLPYFKKSEKIAADFELVNDTDYDQMIRAIRRTVRNNDKSTYEFSKLIPKGYHSADGILPVGHFSYDFYLSGLKKVYCHAVDRLGMDCISDANGENQLGFVFAMGNLEKGTRANAAKVFLNPVKSRNNMFIARKSHVVKVTLKNNRVVGVEVARGGKTFKIRAKKEVILSAGAFNSPKILMLSGIGPAEHLESVGVPVAKHLPGVGQNLQAHPVFFGLPVSIDKDLPEPLKLLQKYDGMYEFLTRGSGLYGNICMNDFVGFVSTQEKSRLPDVALMHFVNHLNDTYLFNELFRALGMKSEVNDMLAEQTAKSKVMLICPAVLTPKSKGTVRLSSGSPEDPPKITTNILKEKEDLDTLLRGIKLAVQLIKTEAFETVQAELLRMDISACEDHKLGTDEYWRCLARHMTTTVHNYAGTCKMGEDEMSVVDHMLKVRGIDGLRVADSSIMPKIIRGNTHVVATMIGEKVSDAIKEQWKDIHDEM